MSSKTDGFLFCFVFLNVGNLDRTCRFRPASPEEVDWEEIFQMQHLVGKSPASLKKKTADVNVLFAYTVLLLSHSSPPPQDGYWEFTPELGKLLNLDVDLFANVFLKSKGIDSLGETRWPDACGCGAGTSPLVGLGPIRWWAWTGPLVGLGLVRWWDWDRSECVLPAGTRARADILRLLATLLVLQLMREAKLEEGRLLRTLFCLLQSSQQRWEGSRDRAR